MKVTDFGIRLKQAMDEKNISAAELSRKSGVGKNLISYYLRGKYLAKQDKVYLLAEALNVDPGWLIYGYEVHDEEPGDMYMHEMMEQHPAELAWFAEVFMNSSPKVQKQIMKILDSFYYDEDSDE